MTLNLYLLPLIKNIYAENPNEEIPWCSHPYEFLSIKSIKIKSQITSISGVMDSKGKYMPPYFIRGISMTRKRDKIWTAIIATRQWFTKLFTREADALVDDFGNNPPPEIEPQSYSGEIHDKGD